METYTSIEAYTPTGSPLFILIKLYIYQDESILNGRLFWTFDILKINGIVTVLGESLPCVVDEKYFKKEIEQACLTTLESMTRAA